MQNIQAEIFQAVKERGYLDGWNESQFAARQIAKMVEELGELANLFQFEGMTWPRALQRAAAAAKVAFTYDHAGWLESGVDLEVSGMRFIEECADVLIPLFCLAEVLGFDLAQEALAKAQSDVKRGIRQEVNDECD